MAGIKLGQRPNGHPRGEVRTAIARWAQAWAASGTPGGLTCVELLALVPGLHADSPADLRLVKNTAANMQRAGELVIVDRVAVPGSLLRLAVYAPCVAPPHGLAGAAAVGAALMQWHAAPSDGGE